MTPTTVCGSPLSSMRAADAAGSALNTARHSRSLSTTTAGAAGAILVAVNSRPIAGGDAEHAEVAGADALRRNAEWRDRRRPG